MRTSVLWLNDYLDPPASADEQAELLTRAGLPFDGRETVGSDIRQEIETTSNRGDCLSHLGLAREVAALSGRRVKAPAATPPSAGPPVESLASVENQRPDLCPLYTARVILGVRIAPSPAWLADRLRAIGQVPRNNVVDCTNFVLFELGQPTHVFDLDRIAGRKVVVRLARPGESLVPIGEDASATALTPDDLVIADAERPLAIAGVKGGAPSAVREGTTNLLLEAATFDPAAVRRTSRRLRIASDSSFRFERGVHPAQVDIAADRLAALILETAGGTLAAGVLRAGAPLPPPRRVRLRVDRCRERLGVHLPLEGMVAALATLGFEPQVSAAGPDGRGALIDVVVPPHRLDVEREIDVIEEVARMAGLDTLPVSDTIAVRVPPPQPRLAARRALREALAGMGFVETVTHTLVPESAAAPFLSPGAGELRVADERARAAPVLRPSVVPSLLRVRRHNQDGGVSALRLFEIASVFDLHRGSSQDSAQGGTGARESHRERETLALTEDLTPGAGLRPLVGAIERLVEIALGGAARIALEPDRDSAPWLAPAARIVATIDGAALPLGVVGAVTPAALRAVGLELPQLAAELDLAALLGRFPPATEARALPAFPSIERDVSAIVEESVAWREVAAAVAALRLPLLEQVEFVTSFRGGPIPAGRKSVTARLRFRAPDRTLRHEEVTPQMDAAVAALHGAVGAEIRS